ncbi:Caveolin [Ancylostoma ceylanicum]|uniref:Caveolin n=1 Tax=Ancylostoma ceylanicum TaxID=53326 RepID=A0A0D6LBW5_9BILA|nr:Caveolin [Ancylostoma ceylanicum]
MPEPPAKKKNPQTAFDFNCTASKEVIACQLNMEDRDQNHLNHDLKPTFALVRIALAQLLTIWPTFLIYIVRPFFYSVGAVFSTFRLHRSDGPVIREVWENV